VTLKSQDEDLIHGFQIGQSKLEHGCTFRGGAIVDMNPRLVNKKSAKEKVKSNIKTNNRVPFVPPARTYTSRNKLS
jgi:heat shock protein HspQ